ncbi:hypothetical protein ACEWY4_006259 [Coilia grayii]|uniref:Ig-like domain-containing protein n=1 Tax=Coilia grayii TaxID=363190 RepID=A0ABD1KD49_9TELE
MCLVLIGLGVLLLIPVYRDHRKYLCQGFEWLLCNTVAYTGDSKEDVEVTDFPLQNMFTVTMSNMPPGGAHYWCAVDIGGATDDKAYFKLSVTEDPDLSVDESVISGEVGGNVSVQCHYSHRYQKEKKRWCRFRDALCVSVGGSDPQVMDNRAGTLSVVMTGLNEADTGWYWCEVGDLQTPVYLNITRESTKGKRKEASVVIAVAFGLLFILAVVSAIAWRESYKTRGSGIGSVQQGQQVEDHRVSAAVW